MHILERTNRLRRIERRFNSPIKDLIYQMHWLEDMKHSEIGRELNIPRVTVTRWFHRFKLPTQSCRRFTDKNLTSWLYKTGQLKKKPRYDGPDRRIQRTKAGLNVDFFKKWSPEMAYVLGYFAADGCMYVNSGGSKFFNFVSTDYELLWKVKDILRSRHTIALKRRRVRNWKDTYLLQIGSKEMYADLLKLGLRPKKELRLSLPEMPNIYLRHFVRGFFDGDGCVSQGYYKRKNRKSKIFVLMTRFASGSKYFLKNLFKRILLDTNLKGCLSKNGTNFHLTYSKLASIKLYDYMYRDVAKEYYLERKHTKFLKAFNEIGVVV